MIGGGRDPLAEDGRQLVDPLPSVANDVGHSPRPELAVLAERMDAEVTAVLEQFADGGPQARVGVDDRRLAHNALVEAVARELLDQPENLFGLLLGHALLEGAFDELLAVLGDRSPASSC